LAMRVSSLKQGTTQEMSSGLVDKGIIGILGYLMHLISYQ